MNKEQIDSILAEVGITLNAKNNAVFNGVKIDDAIANGLLKPHNVTIEQIRTELRNLANRDLLDRLCGIQLPKRLFEVGFGLLGLFGAFSHGQVHHTAPTSL